MGETLQFPLKPISVDPTLHGGQFVLEVKFLVHDCVLYEHMIVCATMMGCLKLKVARC